MDVMLRRRELMGMQGGKLDTSPKIIANDMRYFNGGISGNNNGTSITAVYDLPMISMAGDRQGYAYGIVPSTLNFLDGVYKDYWNQTATDEPHSTTLFSYNTNQAAFTIKTDMIDDCFCYHAASGKILFAGKNSIYYGYANINDMPT